VGADQDFITGGKHERTYGDKKGREGYETKISGGVDGHAIQVQDDQPVLGPYQSQAPHWKTEVPTTSGGSVTFNDVDYLPKDAKDVANKKKWIEKHPYNFYWENQEQGRHLRQKGIETPAMEAKKAFLAYMVYTGDRASPNTGKAMDHVYEVPETVEYLRKDSKGNYEHLRADNRLLADYSNPTKYNTATRRYPDVPGGVPSHDENRTLGGWRSGQHIQQITMPDATQFPYSTVLKPSEEEFNFEPPWRNDPTELSGYESPPPSPFHVPAALEYETDELNDVPQTIPDFGTDDWFTQEVNYDQTKKQTTRKRARPKCMKKDQWKDFAKVDQEEIKKKRPKDEDEPNKRQKT
jgi:hypothetical protein